MSLGFDNAKPPQGEYISEVRAFDIRLIEDTIKYSIGYHTKGHEHEHEHEYVQSRYSVDHRFIRVKVWYTAQGGGNIVHCLVDHKRRGIHEPAHNLNSRPAVYRAIPDL